MPGSLPSSVTSRWTGGAYKALQPGRPRPPSPPVTEPSFELASSCAARIASLTAAVTMSESSSGSSGSIALGSM